MGASAAKPNGTPTPTGDMPPRSGPEAGRWAGGSLRRNKSSPGGNPDRGRRNPATGIRATNPPRIPHVPCKRDPILPGIPPRRKSARRPEMQTSGRCLHATPGSGPSVDAVCRSGLIGFAQRGAPPNIRHLPRKVNRPARSHRCASSAFTKGVATRLF